MAGRPGLLRVGAGRRCLAAVARLHFVDHRSNFDLLQCCRSSFDLEEESIRAHRRAGYCTDYCHLRSRVERRFELQYTEPAHDREALLLLPIPYHGKVSYPGDADDVQ